MTRNHSFDKVSACLQRKEARDGTKRKNRRNTREAILAAAAAEFAEKGFEGASTRAICRRAGVNNALANRYFGTKENLYGQVAQSLFGELGAPLAKLAEGVTDARTWRRAVRTWVEDFLYMTLPTQEAQLRCAALWREAEMKAFVLMLFCGVALVAGSEKGQSLLIQ